MSEILSQLWSPEVQVIITIMGLMIMALYVLCIIWVARDAWSRGAVWYVWAAISLIPIVGVVAYLLLRPPMMQIDHDEQELEVALKQRQLMKYGECSRCGYPVESNYLVCPHCAQRLKNVCTHCHRPLDPVWNCCPWCGAAAPGKQQRQEAPQGNGQGNGRPAPTPSAQAQNGGR